MKTLKNEDPRIQKILNEIDQYSHQMGIYVFAVGGFCRNKILGKPHPIDSDIDLMADQFGGLKTAGMLASNFNVPIRFYHRTGTAILTYKGIDLEFQAFRPNYDVLEEFRKTNVPQNILYLNVYSRDFTINSLLYSLRSKKIYDLTGMGIEDIKTGIIRTPIKSDVLIKSNPIIILRAIMFKNRYEYEIDEELEMSMRRHKDLIPKQISPERFEIAINKILKPNKKRGLKLLYQYDIDEVSPIDFED